VPVQEELAKQQVTVLPHPPFSPDLAPCNFFFFPHLKEKLCGRRFQLAEEIVTATREAVETFLQVSFSSVSAQPYQRQQTCIAANGNYFEGGCGYV
jgi:hypothetical protein